MEAVLDSSKEAFRRGQSRSCTWSCWKAARRRARSSSSTCSERDGDPVSEITFNVGSKAAREPLWVRRDPGTGTEGATLRTTLIRADEWTEAAHCNRP